MKKRGGEIKFSRNFLKHRDGLSFANISFHILSSLIDTRFEINCMIFCHIRLILFFFPHMMMVLDQFSFSIWYLFNMN